MSTKSTAQDAVLDFKQVFDKIEESIKSHHLPSKSESDKLSGIFVNNLIIPKISNEIIKEVYNVMHHHEHCGHGFNHSLRVMMLIRNALPYSRKASEFEMECVLLAGLLHDLDDPKIFKTTNYQNARDLLKKFGAHTHIPIVVKMISLVSCSQNLNDKVEDPLYALPRDADRLDATGQIGLLRSLQFNIARDLPLLTKDTLRPTTKEEIEKLITLDRFNEYRERKGKSQCMIDHYYDKLFYISKYFESENPYFNIGASDRYNDMLLVILEALLKIKDSQDIAIQMEIIKDIFIDATRHLE